MFRLQNHAESAAGLSLPDVKSVTSYGPYILAVINSYSVSAVCLGVSSVQSEGQTGAIAPSAWSVSEYVFGVRTSKLTRHLGVKYLSTYSK